MSEANTAGGVVEARCNSAVLRLARVMIDGSSRRMVKQDEDGCPRSCQ